MTFYPKGSNNTDVANGAIRWTGAAFEQRIGGAWTAFGGGATDINGLSDGYTDAANNVLMGSAAQGALISGGIENTSFGRDSGIALTSGDYNAFFGRSAGTSTTIGGGNTYFGCFAGNSGVDAEVNVAIGSMSLYFSVSGYGNVGIGYAAGLQTTGSYNMFLGHNAGSGNTSGIGNTAIGAGSLANGNANARIAIGQSAMAFAGGAAGSVAIGVEALYNATGATNTAIGSYSGLSATTAVGCVYIGYEAGYSNTTSNKLIIGNTRTSYLIVGDFASNYVGIAMGSAAPTERLDLYDGSGNGAIRIGNTAGTGAGTIRYTGTDFEGRVGAAWLSFTSKTYQQYVTVAKAGGHYTTITAALAAIVDATAIKKYVIGVFPGVYDEAITLKDYIDIVGIGPPRAVVISNAAATVVTMSNANRADIRNVTISRTSTTNNESAIAVSSSGTHLIYDCVVEQTSTNAAGTLISIAGSSVVQINTGQLSLVQAGTTAGAQENCLLHLQGSGALYLRGINGALTIADASDSATAIHEQTAASGSVFWQDCDFTVTITNNSYVGTAIAYDFSSANTDKIVNSSRFAVKNTSGTPGGTGYCYYVDTPGGGGYMKSSANTADVTGFTLNYFAGVATGDTLTSHADSLNCANGYTGAGSFHVAHMPSNGDFHATGTIYNEKFKITTEGGYAVRLTNGTGGNSVKGTLVKASTTADDSFVSTATDDAMPFGVVYESGITNGNPCWVVMGGIAEVLLEDGVAGVHGYWCRTSTTAAGRMTVAATPPGGGVPELDQHEREIGHCLQSVGSGTSVLCRIIMHFN